jgi:hypothetical protein
MNMLNRILLMLVLYTVIFSFSSCNENSIQNQSDNGILIFQKDGLVDSAFVTCCCTSVQRFFSDTINISAYSKIKIQFDGFTNSDGSMIDVYYNTDSSSNNSVITLRNPGSINGLHTIELNSPSPKVFLELRTTIFPPVCGENECKYTRSRDFKIYGIK